VTLRPLVLTFAVLTAAWATASWREQSRRARRGSAFVDDVLLDPADIQRAHRIVVRERPQTKVIHREEGFEIRRVAEKGAPIRETVLRREGSTWVVANAFDLEADLEWMGQTMRDLSQGRLTRHVTSDPALMTDLGLDAGRVRLEDERGSTIRQLELGRKDGGDDYQLVRVDGGAAFVARHEAEILGDPLAWIVTRVFRFEPADVREMELPFRGGREPALRLQRARRGEPLRAAAEPVPDAARVGTRVEKTLARLLAEPVLLVVPHDHAGAAAARRNVAAEVRLALFDGRDYKLGYGVVPAGDRTFAAADVRGEDVIVMVIESSSPQDLAPRYAARVGLVYARAGTLDRLPTSRAALFAPDAAADAGTRR
jgi:hypothetical protein